MNDTEKTESFSQRLKQIFTEHTGEAFDSEIYEEIFTAWKESSDNLKKSLDEVIGVFLLEKCLQCGNYIPLNPNGLCDLCTKALINPKISIDLQEG